MLLTHRRVDRHEVIKHPTLGVIFNNSEVWPIPAFAIMRGSAILGVWFRSQLRYGHSTKGDVAEFQPNITSAISRLESIIEIKRV